MTGSPAALIQRYNISQQKELELQLARQQVALQRCCPFSGGRSLLVLTPHSTLLIAVACSALSIAIAAVPELHSSKQAKPALAIGSVLNLIVGFNKAIMLSKQSKYCLFWQGNRAQQAKLVSLLISTL